MYFRKPARTDCGQIYRLLLNDRSFPPDNDGYLGLAFPPASDRQEPDLVELSIFVPFNNRHQALHAGLQRIADSALDPFTARKKCSSERTGRSLVKIPPGARSAIRANSAPCSERSLAIATARIMYSSLSRAISSATSISRSIPQVCHPQLNSPGNVTTGRPAANADSEVRPPDQCGVSSITSATLFTLR